MKQTINHSEFTAAFHRCGRGEQFSYEALSLLFNYFEELEEDTGEEIELDVIAICCEYTESDAETIASDYSIDLSDCEDDDEKERAVIEYMEDRTAIIGHTSSGMVYANF
jgi:predicted ArsR family transcriptional regulator